MTLLSQVFGFFLNFSVAGWFVVVMSVFISWMMMRINIADQPNQRSSHKRPTPKGGGLAVVLSVFIAFCVLSASEPFVFFAFLPAFIVSFVGFLDDRKEIRWQIRMSIQLSMALIASYIVVYHAEPIELSNNLPQWLLFCLGTFWILSVTNIFNFMDGIDGIAGIEGILTSLILLWVGLALHSFVLYMLNYYLVFGLVGFLIFNFPRAKLFMGDVGSQFIGFILALFGLLIAIQSWDHWYVVPILLFNFLFDSGTTLARRLLKGENIFQAHREHLYQQLVQSGWAHWQVSVLSGVFVLLQISVIMFNESVWQLSGVFQLLLFLPPLVVQLLYMAYVRKIARIFEGGSVE